MSTKTICFTGHRTAKLKSYDMAWISLNLSGAIQRAISRGFTHFISGGALGIDQIAASIVLHIAETHNIDLSITIARPFPSQSTAWPKWARQAYQQLLARVSQVVDVSPDPYTVWKLHKRNRWMVDRSQAVIAVWDGTKGGTANCVSYATKKGKPVLLIQPEAKAQVWLGV